MTDNSDIRKITDSREIKDSSGRMIGREYLVIRKKDYSEKGSWEPFENLLSNKKALKSFYNKHPQLPYPNCLAQTQDEEFSPEHNKSSAKLLRQTSEVPKQKKQKVKPSQSQLKDQPIRNNYKPQKAFNSEVQREQAPSSIIRVEGLYADANTQDIFYHVVINGSEQYQNRKWVMQNCKSELIDFYQRCIRIKDK